MYNYISDIVACTPVDGIFASCTNATKFSFSAFSFFSALTLLVGRQKGHRVLKILMPVIPKDSLSEVTRSEILFVLLSF